MISLDKSKERLLRKLARHRYGKRHGALSAIVVEGLAELEKKEKREYARERIIGLMRKGFDFGLKGKKAYEKRSEIYER